tara:strand:+ start:3401 stop:4012 length:612 start_codon:yes stop_codon:yes gene_type:complete
MGYVTKVNPIGVDIVINNIIESMYEGLESAGWTNYEAYHRCYKNPVDGEGQYIPEAYTAESVNQHDYREVLMDDNKRSSSFFITGDSTSYDNGLFKVPISIIFQLNSQELYDQLVSRADEEARNDAIVSIREGAYGSSITSIDTSIPVVYSEFKTENIAFTDMSPLHVFRVNLSVDVDYSCDYYCTYPVGDGGFDYKMGSGIN